MDVIFDIAATLVAQVQKPTLAFLIGGMMLAALGSKLEVPAPVYKFIVLILLLKVGLGAGISVREADLLALAVPAVAAAVVGVAIVLLGARTLARTRGVAPMDGMATAGLFGAVSASTLAAGMVMLDGEGIAYEGFIGALYPFMDIAALVTAILLAKVSAARAASVQSAGGGTATMTMGGGHGHLVREILSDTFKSPAISALLLGLAIGLLGRPEQVYAGFTSRCSGAFVDPDADHGDGSVAAAGRDAQGGPCLCRLRDRRALRAWRAGVWCGAHCPSPDGIFGRGCGFAGGDGGVKLRHLGPADAAARPARGEPERLCRHLDRHRDAGGHPVDPGLDRAGRLADRF
jgi:hypothetical protein